MIVCHRLIPLLCTLFLTACDTSVPEEAKIDAEAVADKFFAAFEPNRFADAYLLYGDDFWQAVPRSTWQKTLPTIYDELGAIKSCALVTWHGNRTSGDDAGDYITLTYSCAHETQASTILIATKRLIAGSRTEIIGQDFRSSGLQPK